MKVIPVLDILNGVAVHAKRGRRKEYKALKSILSTSADPLEVAIAFKNLGFGELYIADLNAITGNDENFALIEQVAEKTGLQLMVDAGVADIEKAKRVLQHRASKVVVGTETLVDIRFVEQSVNLLGSDHVIVSFDMKDGRLLSRFSLEKFPNQIDVLRQFEGMGLTQVILLDLARVGSEEGVEATFLQDVLKSTDLKVLVGGGVRDLRDLGKLNDMGVSGVLLATALHSGKITVEELTASGLMLS